MTFTLNDTKQPASKSFTELYRNRHTKASLQDLKHYRGEAFYLAAILEMMMNLSDFFSVGHSLTDRMIETLGRLIYEKCATWKVDELMLCFDNAMKGVYGAVYNRLDGGVVMMWLNEWEKDRNAALEEMRYIEHRETVTQQPMSPEMAAKVLEIFKSVKPVERPQKKTRWPSIESYCFANDQDVNEFLQPYIERWTSEYLGTDRVPIELWIDYKKSCLLHELTQNG